LVRFSSKSSHKVPIQVVFLNILANNGWTFVPHVAANESLKNPAAFADKRNGGNPMANPVGAVPHVPHVAQVQEASAAKPAANVTKLTPQDTVNISAAGKAASQAKPATKLAEDAKHNGENK
jgi:hypothetical protein